jgi:hypothetical protein
MRNYKKESEWQRKKYKRLVADIDHNINDRLQEQLGKDKKTFKQWLSEMIENYIGGVK